MVVGACSRCCAVYAETERNREEVRGVWRVGY